MIDICMLAVMFSDASVKTICECIMAVTVIVASAIVCWKML